MYRHDSWLYKNGIAFAFEIITGLLLIRIVAGFRNGTIGPFQLYLLQVSMASVQFVWHESAQGEQKDSIRSHRFGLDEHLADLLRLHDLHANEFAGAADGIDCRHHNAGNVWSGLI